MKNSQKIGLYSWGGPSTIHLIKTKYHSPKIDQPSFLELYDLDSLQKIQQTLGVTDMWVTYSWGFSAEHEAEGYEFIRERLPNFQRVGIQAHAYIQGLNVVTQDFADETFFCVDGAGRPLSYSKGRSFICPNNPAAKKLILDRVTLACQENFAGIYVDNILFGLPPIYVKKNYASSFGCSCEFCQMDFQKKYSYRFQPYEKENSELEQFLQFRCNSVFSLLSEISKITKKHKKAFAINLYDPILLDPRLYYGYDLEQIAPLLDYFLIENHQHPLSAEVGNQHLRALLASRKKPTFIVSYKAGIGREPAFTQQDLDAIATESNELGYSPCYKGTEFTTNGEWHAVRLEGIHKPKTTAGESEKPKHVQKKTLGKASFIGKVLTQRLDRFYSRLVRAQYEQAWLHTIIHKWGIFTFLMKQNQLKYSSHPDES